MWEYQPFLDSTGWGLDERESERVKRALTGHQGSIFVRNILQRKDSCSRGANGLVIGQSPRAVPQPTLGVELDALRYIQHSLIRSAHASGSTLQVNPTTQSTSQRVLHTRGAHQCPHHMTGHHCHRNVHWHWHKISPRSPLNQETQKRWKSPLKKGLQVLLPLQREVHKRVKRVVRHAETHLKWP